MTNASTTELYVIDEVVHFGGFFQGDTVGLKAHPLGADGSEPQTLTIDDHVWTNLREKHNLRQGHVLRLRLYLGEVAEASVLGHPQRETLREAIVERNISPTPDLRAIAYSCKQCGMWIAEQPARAEQGYACTVCGSALQA